MADLRTRYPITENQWSRIVNGGTAAKIFRSLNGPTYYSMLYDSGSDVPPAGILPDTAEIMFEGGNTDLFEYPSAAYLWVTCKGENGAVIVTE